LYGKRLFQQPIPHHRRMPMKLLARVLCLLALTALALPARAQMVTGRFVTAFTSWEKFDTTNSSTTYLRAYQTAQLSIAQGDVSVHTYLQGTMNTTNPFGERGYLRVYNLYLRWANIFRALDLTAGRQGIYAGVGSGSIDGLQARVRLFQERLTVTGYGGVAVAPGLGKVRTDLNGNYMVGGQAICSPLPSLRVGASYMKRREERDPYWTLRTRDSAFAAVPYYIQTYAEAEEYASGDVAYAIGHRVELYGRYDYDVNLEKTSRGEVSARVAVTEDFAVTGDFIHRQPRLAYNSIFGAFTSNPVNEVEGGVEYGFTPLFRGYARLGRVSYTDDHSTRWTMGLNSTYGSFSYSGSDGYAGQLQAFSVQASYPVFNRMLVPSAGLSYASYRLSREQLERDHALTVALGITYRPVPTFSVDVQGQMMQNRTYSSDGRILVKFNYWFAQRLSLFGQEGTK
jgi:hypothetical protein